MNVKAVTTGVAVGLITILVTRLFFGADASVIGGALTAASIAASAMTSAK